MYTCAYCLYFTWIFFNVDIWIVMIVYVYIYNICWLIILLIEGWYCGVECNSMWVTSRNCGCLVTWFCYQLIAKPGNKTAAVLWPDPCTLTHCGLVMLYGDVDLGEKWLRYLFVVWLQEAITCINVDFLLKGFNQWRSPENNLTRSAHELNPWRV